MSMCGDLEWGFEDGENFDESTYFYTAEEFKVKYDKLLTDEEHYKKCYERQKYIVKKYFTKSWMSSYILSKIM